jgi:hypothetical protein
MRQLWHNCLELRRHTAEGLLAARSAEGFVVAFAIVPNEQTTTIRLDVIAFETSRFAEMATPPESE